MRVLNALRFDMLFQLRHGFYYAYLLITLVYVLALLNLPADMRAPVATLLLFADIAPLVAL